MSEEKKDLLPCPFCGSSAMLSAAPKASQKVSNTDGWVMVPVEPTNAMVEAAELDACGRLLADDIADAYSAMLSAAPTPPQQQEQAGTTQEAVAWVELSDSEIEEGRNQVFSTSNPYCPCDAKTMRKAVRWAEAKIKERIRTLPGSTAALEEGYMRVAEEVRLLCAKLNSNREIFHPDMTQLLAIVSRVLDEKGERS